MDPVLASAECRAMVARVAERGSLSLAELDVLHYDCEMLYARLIHASAKGSAERRALFHAAYDALMKVLAERRRRHGRPMDALGFNREGVRALGALTPPGGRVLDVGCSAGVLVEKLLRQDYQAEGIDVAQELVESGNARLSAAGLASALHCGDFLEFSAADESYDLIHSNDVLEHIHPDEALDFLSKCRRLLRPGGRLVLITPNRLIGPGDATRMRAPIGARSQGLHLREYSLRELCRLLRRSGFGSITARLWSSDRLRPPTSRHRAIYARLKVLLEPCFWLVPGRIRTRLMSILCYPEVVARKSSIASL